MVFIPGAAGLGQHKPQPFEKIGVDLRPLQLK
jgi:hypothetical protein